MKIELSIPSKVFIAGEYLALQGEPALVACLAPRFSLSAELAGSKQPCPFHSESPAGLWWNKYEKFYSQYAVAFFDPYKGLGGWGGSTAEFALLYKLQNPDSQPLQVLHDYRSLFSKNIPSGADLIAQLSGGVTYFDRKNSVINVYRNFFPNLDILFVSTGLKLKTHEHLSQLEQTDFSALLQPMKQIQQSIGEQSNSQFLTGISAYASVLQKFNLVTENTAKILQKLNLPGLAAKGCGAMGADVVMVVSDKKQRSSVELLQLMNSLDLKVINSSNNLSDGFLQRDLSRDFINEVWL